ncbi:uncharacterized protein PGTG_05500 [Puccinia graminis f. sp. tritici CRL 75-36-700-3]|uniref:Uncharacterized protein n=1 Tax=Puccinia graminis f. sp. tritici (strain CRL 75-36-700-3 / race SCCL) TaxID=418459 RepID=E3K4L3_PUCGT|nr:uncharacterized protein PGTG_05500 [Puccinia graminis f. sp. tritici CRL 75-36-700-3]EFP79179.2 hypothetical protein PGTG_05500 [Puccinia graminis f. sp. tritici CRL 75-36-700-3]
MYKLGFSRQEYQKSQYFDGHERPDVVLSRKKYVDDYLLLRQRSRKYGGENFEISTEIDPEILVHMKETIFIFHDKSTIHAKERPSKTWLLPGTSELRSKSSGRLVLSKDELEKLKTNNSNNRLESEDAATIIYPGSTGDKWWDMEQLCHQVSQKAIPIFESLHPNAQGVFVFDCSSAHGAFSPSALRVQKMNLGHGGKQARLRDTVIPSDDPLIPLHLCGQPQTLSYNDSHPDPERAVQQKGVKAVLKERGLWQHYTCQSQESGKPALTLSCKTCTTSNIWKDAISRAEQLIQQAEDCGYFLSNAQSMSEIAETEAAINQESEESTLDQVPNNAGSMCCWSRILSLQSDFANKRPLLQTIIED